jgi:undecaprenyl-diphosphatase
LDKANITTSLYAIQDSPLGIKSACIFRDNSKEEMSEEDFFKDESFFGKISEEKEISFLRSFIIGCWQCLALIPGMSRSAASIIGGMQQKLSRSAAAEFSFFLAVPTMLAATGYKLLKYYLDAGGFTMQDIQLLAVGNVVAFIVALLAIKFFIGFLKKYGFRIWGVYRIIVGIALLILIKTGYLNP